MKQKEKNKNKKKKKKKRKRPIVVRTGRAHILAPHQQQHQNQPANDITQENVTEEHKLEDNRRLT